MKKILIFAGVILLFVLILSAWFFIGNLGNFAQFLGKESTDIFANEKSRFIGSWETAKDTSLYTFNSDGTYSHGSTNGTYEIEDGKLVLHGFATLPYEYEFSDNDNTATIDLNGGGTVVYVLTKE